jgi:pimeloyl-ACP methyl ester carboxylesterase
MTAAESLWVDLDGPVHYVDHGGPPTGPLLVLVHGLGGSLVNWSLLAPRLTGSCRVLALDLAGFGRTQGHARNTSVHGNRELLDRFLREVAGTPAIIVGNSMGGLITILQAAQEPATAAGAVLIDPALSVGPGIAHPDPRITAMFAAMSVPAVGRRLLQRGRDRVSAEVAAEQTLAMCINDMSRLPPDVIAAHTALALERREYEDIDAQLLTAAQSLVWVLLNRGRYTALQQSIGCPVLLLHGDADRLVPIAAARAAARANPGWTFAIAADVGHTPQLEVPDWTARQILQWLAAHPAVAAAAAGAAAG